MKAITISVTALLLLLPLLLYAQTSDSIKSRVILSGISFSPAVSNRKLISAPAVKAIAEGRNAEEVAKFGFSTGIGLMVKLNKRFILETGVLYSNAGFQTKKTDLIWPIGDASFPVKSKTVYTYNFITFPFKLNYHLFNKVPALFLSAGVAINNFTGKKTLVKLYYENGNTSTARITKTLGYSKWNIAALFGLGVGYNVSRHLYLKFEPGFCYSLTPATPGLSIKDHLYNVNLTTGLYWKFK